MKTLYSKWTKEEYKVAEVTYKTHFKRTKTVEAKIRRYEKNQLKILLMKVWMKEFLIKKKNFL